MRVTHNFDFAQYLKEPYRTIYIVGATNALRVSDIVEMKKDRLKVQRPVITEKKTGKKKRLYIPANCKSYMQTLAKLSPNDYIFYSTGKTGHITRQAVFSAFKKAGKRANVQVNIGTHSMRKNSAYAKYTATGSMEEVQKKLNHENATESAIYII